MSGYTSWLHVVDSSTIGSWPGQCTVSLSDVSDWVALDSSSSLYITSAFDYERHGDVIAFTVTCTDVTSNNHSVDVIILVYDVDDNAPTARLDQDTSLSEVVTISDEVHHLTDCMCV